jgi:hypothetical protein
LFLRAESKASLVRIPIETAPFALRILANNYPNCPEKSGQGDLFASEEMGKYSLCASLSREERSFVVLAGVGQRGRAERVGPVSYDLSLTASSSPSSRTGPELKRDIPSRHDHEDTSSQFPFAATKTVNISIIPPTPRRRSIKQLDKDRDAFNSQT